MTALSILDLVRVTRDTDARGALDNARDLAVHSPAAAVPSSPRNPAKSMRSRFAMLGGKIFFKMFFLRF